MSDIEAIRERHDSMQRTKDFSIGFFTDDAFDDAHADRAFLLSALSAAEARAEAAEARAGELRVFKDAVIGWRERDWPTWFCRATADRIVSIAIARSSHE